MGTSYHYNYLENPTYTFKVFVAKYLKEDVMRTSATLFNQDFHIVVFQPQNEIVSHILHLDGVLGLPSALEIVTSTTSSINIYKCIIYQFHKHHTI